MRGLDYYTRSVWEVWPPVVGAQSTLGGGGRYDGLAEQLGGKPTPGVGFASGIERIVLELKDQAGERPAARRARRVLRVPGRARQAARLPAGRGAARGRASAADLAFGDRKLGKQLSAADRAGAHWGLILGEDEIASDTVTLKDLRIGGDQRRVAQRELVQVLTADQWLD